MPQQVDQLLLEAETRLSLGELNKLAQQYLTRILETQHALRLASIPFKEKGNILPIHCRATIDTLDELNKRVCHFCALLNETSNLPIVCIPQRYRLLFALQVVEEKASKLVDRIEGFYKVCMMPTPQSLRQRREIYDSFETLLQHTADISQQVHLLDTEANAPEQNLALHFQEELTSDLTGPVKTNIDKRLPPILKEDASEASQTVHDEEGEQAIPSNITPIDQFRRRRFCHIEL